MKKESKHEIHFDLLRILAMLLVMLFHYTTQYSNTVQPTSFWVFFSSDYSAFAVALFLLMVGFFSYKSIKKNLSPVSYLKNRLLRLFPTFWLCLIITSMVLTISGTSRVSVKQFLMNAFLINRFLNVPFVDGVYWYMIIVLVFTAFITFTLFYKESQKRTILYVLYTATYVIFGFLNRFVHTVPKVISFALFEYLNKCFIGLFLAFLYFEGKEQIAKSKVRWVLLIASLMLGEFLWIGARKAFIEILAVSLFTGVIYLGNHLKTEGRTAEILFMISNESYFIYLIHQQVGFVLIKTMISHGINCNYSVFIAFSFVASLAAVHYCVRKTAGKKLINKA